jgi:hypothetical protein
MGAWSVRSLKRALTTVFQSKVSSVCADERVSSTQRLGLAWIAVTSTGKRGL